METQVVVAPSRSILVTPQTAVVVAPHRNVIVVAPRQITLVGPSEPAITIAPSTVEQVRPTRPATVSPPARGAWAERGWSSRATQRGQLFEGMYHAGGQRYQGRIEVEDGGRTVKTYIRDPPAGIKRHRHGPCFQQCGIGTGWFMLHWRRPAHNADDALLYMEKVLAESYAL